jgi:Ca-activated chloride channel family protein
MINYFPPASGDIRPEKLPRGYIDAAYEIAPCPWDAEHLLLRFEIKTPAVGYKKMPPANLTFMIDNSSSMIRSESLPLLKNTLLSLVEHLSPCDRVSIITYSGSSEVYLSGALGSEKDRIRKTIERLCFGGEGRGIREADLRKAYLQAKNAFTKAGRNRILFFTGGDFNLKGSDVSSLEEMLRIEKLTGYASLDVLGLGSDIPFHDEVLRKVASAGSGNYYYIDNMAEAEKILSEKLGSVFATVTEDVRAQIEFNPANVTEFRLIAYEEHRRFGDNDFADAVDNAMISGKRFTILYELTPAAADPNSPSDDEIASVRLQWKRGCVVSDARIPIMKSAIAKSFNSAGTALRFYAAVAAYGQKLRNSPHLAGTGWNEIESWAENAKGDDPYRAEFARLVKIAASLMESRGD